MKYRVIRQAEPAMFIFKPLDEEQERTEELTLSFEELEAISLTNLDNLIQRAAAEQMKISQPTFNRLLNGAYKKITQFLVNGKKLEINGGNYMLAQRRFLCTDCKADWGVPYGTPRPAQCPQCGSTNLHRHPDDRGTGHRGRRRHGAGMECDGAGAGAGRGRGAERGAGQGPINPNTI